MESDSSSKIRKLRLGLWSKSVVARWRGYLARITFRLWASILQSCSAAVKTSNLASSMSPKLASCRTQPLRLRIISVVSQWSRLTDLPWYQSRSATTKTYSTKHLITLSRQKRTSLPSVNVATTVPYSSALLTSTGAWQKNLSYMLRRAVLWPGIIPKLVLRAPTIGRKIETWASWLPNLMMSASTQRKVLAHQEMTHSIKTW